MNLNNLRLYITVVAAAMSVLFISNELHADIVITKDEMILNGKILEDKAPDHIVFANFYGTFTIKYKVIKEIHKTESFEDDVKIYKDMGKAASEEEIKKNYLAGEEKLRDQAQEQGGISTEEKESFVLMLELAGYKNLGEIAGVLPYSSGIALSGEFHLDFPRYLKDHYLYGIDSEAGWFTSENGERKTGGLYVSAGPLWQIPAEISGYSFIFNISSLLGAGWYSVVNNEVDKQTSAVKWNLTVNAGPVFRYGSVILSAQIRLNYIYDGAAPVSGAGVLLGAGYAF